MSAYYTTTKFYECNVEANRCRSGTFNPQATKDITRYASLHYTLVAYGINFIHFSYM